MFFSQIVLYKKGTLGKVWLAGHWDSKISKQVVFKTDIRKSINNILRPHLPMALRMTSHLLLGIVRIYQKKTKYLLNDCSEAVTKLKNLSMKKSTTKVDMPVSEQVDPQSLLTTGPRAAETSKPQVYKEVDRFLRNIDLRDLVMDSFYDPSKINPETKERGEEIDAALRTPGAAAAGTTLGSTGARDDSSRKYRDGVELRDFQSAEILSPSGLGRPVESPAGELRSPEEMQSIGKTGGVLEALEARFDPVSFENLKTPTTPGGARDDLANEDFDKPLDFGPGKIDFGGDDTGMVFPDFPRDDHDFPPIPMDVEGEMPHLSPPVVPDQHIDTQMRDQESTEVFDKISDDERPTQKPVSAAAAAKKKRARRAEKGTVLTDKEKRRRMGTKGLEVDREQLSSKERDIVERTREPPAKVQLLAPTRIMMAENLQKFYEDTLQYKIPAIIGVNAVLPLSYLRGRRSYALISKIDRETNFLTNENRSLAKLGVPQYPDYNEEEEKKREKIVLASINNRDLENERAPEIVPLVQPEDPTEKTIYDDFFEEIKLRGDQGTPLFYHGLEKSEDSRDKLLRKSPGLLGEISPYKGVPDIDETMSLTKSSKSALKQIPDTTVPLDYENLPGDMHYQMPQDDFVDFQAGQLSPPRPHAEEEPILEDEETRERKLQELRQKYKSTEPKQKIWSQKTARMHTVLNSFFKQSNQIKLLDDMIQGGNRKRQIAAGIFYELLILKTKDLVDVNQAEPYGEIVIKKTENFDNTYDWKIVDESTADQQKK